MIISGGELVLADATPTAVRSTYYPTAGINLTALFATYGAIYKKQQAVYTLVRKRALATRRLPLKVYRREVAGRVEERDHPYAVLLREPNPRMSGAFLWEWTSSTFDIYGEAIWLKVRGRDRRPAQLWPVHPSNISVQVADADQAQRWSVPKGSLLYVYAVGMVSPDQAQFVIPERDVVHFKSYNPESTSRGLSPLEALRMTLLNEDAARRASAAFWNNGGRPSGFLSTPKSLSEGAANRLKAQWDAIHGGVDNFGKWAVLEEGMEPKPLSLTAEESQYVESRKLNREEACMVYDVPPPVVHILDRATFSNITEQMRSMYRDTMAPHLGGFEETLDFQLRPEFDASGDLYGEFLMDEVLRGDFEQRVDAYQKGVNSGWLTPAEVRQMENLPPLPGSDRLFVNSTLVPIDTAGAKAAIPATATDVTANRSLDVLWGRLGSYTSVDDIEPERLVAGLNGHAATVRSLLDDARRDGDSMAGFRARCRTALT